MQPLILFQDLSSQLKDDELNNLIQTVISLFGAKRILSFIFNHLLLQYNQNKEHHDDLASITQMVSNILNSRKPPTVIPIDDDITDTATPQISIEMMPSAIIGECASYLHSTDYLHFARCSRKTYIGCHSPSTLQVLSTINKDITETKLDRLASLKSFGLNIDAFNEYMDLHPKQGFFHQLEYLLIDNGFEQDCIGVQAFMTHNCIPFSNITRLCCDAFGWGHGHGVSYDFTSFCRLLSSFPNVTQLQLDLIYLTAYIESNNINALIALYPNLSVLSVKDSVSHSVLALRNQLISLYSNQLESLTYCESVRSINQTSFPMLKELWVVNPNIDSLHHIIENTPSLERLNLVIPTVLDDTKMSRTIIAGFAKCDKMESISIKCDYETCQKIIKDIEIALFHMATARHQLTMVFTIKEQLEENEEESDQETHREINKREMYLWLCRLMNALDTSKIDHFMLGFDIELETFNFDSNMHMERFEESHLVYIDNNSRSIRISNKNCKISGYQPRWINGSHTDLFAWW